MLPSFLFLQADIDALRAQPEYELQKSLMKQNREMGRLLATERAATSRARKAEEAARKAEEQSRVRAEAAEAELQARGIEFSGGGGGSAVNGGKPVKKAAALLLPGEAEDAAAAVESNAELWKVRTSLEQDILSHMHIPDLLDLNSVIVWIRLKHYAFAKYCLTPNLYGFDSVCLCYIFRIAEAVQR